MLLAIPTKILIVIIIFVLVLVAIALLAMGVFKARVEKPDSELLDNKDLK